MYLWKNLHSEESELIHKVLKSQEVNAHQGDWVWLVKYDMNKLNLGNIEII